MNVRPSSLGLDACGGSCSSPPVRGDLARHVMADGESVHGKDAGDHRGVPAPESAGPIEAEARDQPARGLGSRGHDPQSMSHPAVRCQALAAVVYPACSIVA